MFKKISILTIASLMLVGAAAADDRGDKKGRMVQIDTNGDGFVTKSEMMSHHTKKVNEHFAKMDKNNDGKLSKEEMRSGKKEMRKNMKERMDKWKDKKEEHKEKRAERKAKRDATEE